MIAYMSFLVLEVDTPWKIIGVFQSIELILSDGQVRNLAVWHAISVMFANQQERWKQTVLKTYLSLSIIRYVLIFYQVVLSKLYSVVGYRVK